jgi:hypothetical protein
MRIFTILLTGLLCSLSAISQNIVKGKIQDQVAKTPLSGATVQLKNSNLTRNAITAKTGEFTLSDIPDGSYKISISFVGYDASEKLITLQGKTLDMGTIVLNKGSKDLEEVVVKATTPPAQQKGDTVQFNASQFKVNPDANVEDLIKKMPGVVVDNGTVKAQGENVKKVTIDGREFFGDDAAAALRNLPAEVVDKIQVFDKLSDQAQLTGIDDGNGYKAINVVTREDKRNGQFGRMYAGYGTQDRYQAGGAVNFFNKNRRISVVGLFNNINQQNFSGSDILGLTGTGSGRGGGGAGRGGPGGDFQVAGRNGITTTNSLGINYSDLWGKNFNVTGSYFFNNNNNQNNSISNREQIITPDSSTFYREIGATDNKSSNHRINMRMEYKIDSNNTLLIIPSLNIQQNDNTNKVSGIQSLQTSDLISTTETNNRTKGNGYSFNNSLIFRHAFAKKGRSVSIGITTGMNTRDATQETNSVSAFFKAGIPDYDSILQQQVSDIKGYNLSTNLVYTEPLGKKGLLQFSYNPSYSNNDADQRTWRFDQGEEKYSILDTSLSNVFKSQITTQKGGISYRFGDKDKNLSIGLDAQEVKMNNDQTYPESQNLKKTFSNLLPNAMLRLKLTDKSNIRIFYRSSTNNPSVGQLQNVPNNPNALYITTGNPDLDQSVSNRLGGRYTYTNSRKGNSLFINLFATQTDNFITNATFTPDQDSVLTPSVILKQGAQLSKPINMNGYWNLNTLITYSFPFKPIKSNLTFNAGGSFIRTPGQINNVSNIASSYTYTGGLVIASNISEYVDFNVNYNANYNIVKNSIQESRNNNYFSQTAGIGVSLLSKNGWIFQNDLNNQLYHGLSAAFNQNYWLWNMAVARKFLKDQKGELRLSVFDLLKQNRSITRTVTANYIEDLQTQVLTQYFMLTFSYKLKNFGKTPERKRQGAGSREGMPWN